MNAVRAQDRSSYLKLLLETPGEAELLRKDLLIGVTQFFRGKSAFEFLANEIIPKLVNQQSDGERSVSGVPAAAPVKSLIR